MSNVVQFFQRFDGGYDFLLALCADYRGSQDGELLLHLAPRQCVFRVALGVAYVAAQVASVGGDDFSPGAELAGKVGVQLRVGDALDARQDVAYFGAVRHAIGIFLERCATVCQCHRRAEGHGELHIYHGLGVGLVFLRRCHQLEAPAKDPHGNFLNVL